MNFLELFNSTGLIGAHRGARSVSPENTLIAMQKSVGKCDFIELDVRLSSDGVAVVMHDYTLCRTTNISEMDSFKNRENDNVCEFTCKELSTLDYGSWFYTNDPFSQIEDGNVDIPKTADIREPLLTLDKALEFIGKHNIYLNIEIKDISYCMDDDKLIAAVSDSIKRLHVESLVLISSYRHEYLTMFKEKMPHIPTAAILEDDCPDDIVEYLGSIDVDACHLDNRLVDLKLVHNLKSAGYFVNVFTVNDFVRIKELFGMGVNGVFTDFI